MKDEPGHITDELLVKYLLNEASDSERRQVQAWTLKDQSNKQHFEHFKLIWDQSKNFEASSAIDENAAWERFKLRVAANEKQATTIQLSVHLKTWLRVAAVLLLMAGGGWVYYYYNVAQGNMTAFASGNNILTQTLPDGSIVTLNKNSLIEYPGRFGGNIRQVTLTGEAFFNVAPDRSHPFVITARDARIKVVGTTFNVKSNAERTEVIVETGIVEVSKKMNTVSLRPKQKATVMHDEDAPVKEQVNDELYNYYRTHEFICNATPLYKLVDVLNEVYGANIVIEDERLRNLPLTTTFHNESLDGILNVISETLNVKVEKQDDKIILK